MKFKLLPIIIASMTLVACGTSEPSSTSTPSSAPASSSQPITWSYLDFLSGENNARFDIFDFEDGLQVSYGNTALVAGANNLKLNDNSEFSVNKDLANEVSFNTMIIAEKHQQDGLDHVFQKVLLGTEGDHLTELFALIKDSLKGYERAYVAFSIGTPAKWTKGLNTNMDEFFQGRITPTSDAE